ncbi:MAG: carbohydrate kinase [Gammaproteobacteria bacterium]|nr:MAG: carbohydrate kinase [Gammaproteobacteria bacterium]RLA57153.1 MAG: carbohydrate kinase [Gammaproteobacteria bacterium]HDY82329.1 carbohydrate kinase [Halieaceae bacterium]
MNQNKPYVLAIDNGTQSVRALVFDLEGQLVAKSKVDIDPYFSTEPGWAEQEPDYYWAMLCQSCRELWPQLDFPKSQIKAVALTTLRATMVNIDSEGKPLRPAFVWLDQREQDELDAMNPAWELLFALAGEKQAVQYFRTQAEANWIAHQQPEIWKQTHKYLLLSGFHTHKLTGEFVDSVSSQVGYLPFDFKRHDWCRRRDWKWQALPIRPDMLPRLIPSGSELGKITEQASLQTGIPAGLPLISAGADKACEVLGSGCLTPETGSLSYGTTATYNTTNSKYVEAIRHIPPYPAAMPNTYNTEVIVQRGYWMVSWFKKEFGLREEQLATEKGIETEVLFDDLLRQVPAGCMGLMVQPYWNPGIRTPGPEAKGAMIGFGDIHTRAHIYRAIIEGIAYALREGRELSEKKSGVKITSLKVSGGGSQSDEAMQITADIFGITAERPHTFETSGLGAAINAAVGVGLYPDYEAALDQMVHEGDKFMPIAKNQHLYDQLYQKVYRKMYGNLSPLYKAIRRITGYPK